uniref:Uncharacterized protein n=1 Tax=Anguilla anguilla TaxID=7936 RepID=A0A0E9XCM9_ANGAN
MIRKVVSELKPSTCSLDPIPTPFLKNVFNYLSEELLCIVNHSLFTGTFPDALKTARQTTYQKK